MEDWWINWLWSQRRGWIPDYGGRYTDEFLMTKAKAYMNFWRWTQRLSPKCCKFCTLRWRQPEKAFRLYFPDTLERTLRMTVRKSRRGFLGKRWEGSEQDWRRRVMKYVPFACIIA
jgi:hypothetical protein